MSDQENIKVAQADCEAFNAHDRIRCLASCRQQVISEGPYAIMRHPAFAAGLFASVTGGLALTSLLSIILVVVIALPILV